MTEATGPSPRTPRGTRRTQRRAQWLALIKLRRRARLVGQTETNEPIVLVAGRELVYSGDRGRYCFRPIVPCARCGRNVPSPAETISRAAQLRRNGPSIICAACSGPPSRRAPPSP